MEEFKSAHLRMFGKSTNLLNRDESSSSCPPLPTPATIAPDAVSTGDHNGKSESSGGSSNPATDSNAITTTAVKNVGNNHNQDTSAGVTPSKLLNARNANPKLVTNAVRKESAPLSDKTITAPVTRSPANNNVTSSSSSSPSSSSCTPIHEKKGNTNHASGEKVMILKTSSSSALNPNVTPRKQHPPPPPPPLPGTTVTPAAAAKPAPAPAPLVTITSYQTKLRSNNNNNRLLLRELESKSSSQQQQNHALPVKINLIKSGSRDDK